MFKWASRMPSNVITRENILPAPKYFGSNGNKTVKMHSNVTLASTHCVTESSSNIPKERDVGTKKIKRRGQNKIDHKKQAKDNAVEEFSRTVEFSKVIHLFLNRKEAAGKKLL
jgi:hypothetical protein